MTRAQDNMRTEDIAALRKQIDLVDQKMAELFEERMHIAEGIAAYKLRTGKPVFDPERERAVIEKNIARIQDESLRVYYDEFIRSVMNISKNYQTEKINDSL